MIRIMFPQAMVQAGKGLTVDLVNKVLDSANEIIAAHDPELVKQQREDTRLKLLLQDALKGASFAKQPEANSGSGSDKPSEAVQSDAQESSLKRPLPEPCNADRQLPIRAKVSAKAGGENVDLYFPPIPPFIAPPGRGGNSKAYKVTPVQPNAHFPLPPARKMDPTIFPLWTHKQYHPIDPNDPEYSCEWKQEQYYARCKTNSDRDILAAHWWSYHTSSCFGCTFTEPADCVIISVLSQSLPANAGIVLQPLTAIRDPDLANAWDSTLSAYLQAVFPASYPQPVEDQQPSGGTMGPPPVRSRPQCVDQTSPVKLAPPAGVATTPPITLGEPPSDNSSMVGGVVASSNTANFCKAMIEERFKLASIAQKADFVALASILGITLSPSTFSSADNRQICIDEIAEAILKRGVDTSNIPSIAEVKKMKAELSSKRALDTEMTPALTAAPTGPRRMNANAVAPASESPTASRRSPLAVATSAEAPNMTSCEVLINNVASPSM